MAGAGRGVGEFHALSSTSLPTAVYFPSQVNVTANFMVRRHRWVALRQHRICPHSIAPDCFDESALAPHFNVVAEPNAEQ
jgi:hypothetical protein